MPAFFSRPKKYPITEKPITSPTDKRIYQDIFNLIATFLNLFRDLDSRLEDYVTEAPDDGKTYGRKDKDWTEIVSGDGIPEAPEDGQLYGRKDAAWEVVSGGGGSSIWGSITGTLSDQTDLQSALNGKENTIASGTTAQYYRGDKTWQTLDTGAVAGLGSAALADIAYFATAIQGALADTAVQPSDLAAVAFSGDYDDLAGDAPSDGSTYGRKDGAWAAVANVNVYNKLKTILIAGTNITLTWDDVNETVTIDAAAIGPVRTEFPGAASIVFAQVSTYPGVTSANATNMRDNLDTTGTGTNTTTNAWIRADLGSAVLITAIQVGGGNVPSWGTVANYLNGAILQYASSTGGPWNSASVTISGVTDSGPELFKQFALPIPISARYWRLLMSANYLSTTEFRFYID